MKMRFCKECSAIKEVTEEATCVTCGRPLAGERPVKSPGLVMK